MRTDREIDDDQEKFRKSGTFFGIAAGSIHGGGGGFAVPDDARSHISQMSSRAAAKRAASIADLTGKPSYPGMASAMGLGLSRPGQ